MEHDYWQRARRFAKSDLANYDIHVLMYKMSQSVINIFVPILLLMSGFSLIQVAAYWFIGHLLKNVFTFIASPVAEKLGIRNTMLLGLISGVTYFLLIHQLNKPDPVFLTGLAVAWGAYIGLYWGPQRAILMPAISHKKVGVSLAGVSFFRFVASLLSPLLGAVLILAFGKDLVAILAAGAMLLSIIPLYKMKNNKFERKISLIKLLSIKKHQRALFGMIPMGMIEVAHHELWPVFVFLLLHDLLVIGYIGSLVALGALIMAFIVGKLSDENRVGKLFLFGAVVAAATYFARPFAETQFIVLIITLVYALVKEPFKLPVYAAFYAEGKKKYHAEYSLLAELVKNTARLFVYLPLLLWLSFDAAFALAGLSCLVLAGASLVKWGKT